MRWRGLLVSVRDGAEAAAALDGGAAIIDIKDPQRGSLGAASPAAVADVAMAVGPRVAWTVAAGELQEARHDPLCVQRWLDAIRAALQACQPCHSCQPAALKIGLAGMRHMAWPPLFREVLSAIPEATASVAVAYADWQAVDAPHPLEIVAEGAAAGCAALLVDTADKTGPGLLRACAAADLAKWVGCARAAGMAVTLAGRLTLAELPLLAEFAPDVVALRSAVCSNGRTGRVESALVRRAARSLTFLENAPHETARSSRAPSPWS